MLSLSKYQNENGSEVILFIEADPGMDFKEAVVDTVERFDKTLGEFDETDPLCLYRRWYLSDIVNNIDPLKSILRARAEVILDVFVGQPPASGAKIACEAFFLLSTHLLSKRLSGNGSVLDVDHNGYTSRLIDIGGSGAGCVYQTNDLFRRLIGHCQDYPGSFNENMIRTWIYVRDIDRHYHAMADQRRIIFDELGLNENTHYIASTGIESKMPNADQLVHVVALARFGLKSAQFHYLQAPDYLSPTHAYRVTFERGTKITYGDRSHFIISGTASVDCEGVSLYCGDVIAQTRRTLTNMEALLADGGAGLRDMMYFIVYIRDSSDYSRVRTTLVESLPKECPLLVLNGSICRPEWLIEIEGIAVTSVGDGRFPAFL